jgi:hypothetical protein
MLDFDEPFATREEVEETIYKPYNSNACLVALLKLRLE